MATGPFDSALIPGVFVPPNFGNAWPPAPGAQLAPMPPDSFEYQQQAGGDRSTGNASSGQKPLTAFQKVKSFCNGLISPLTDPFKSPTKFATAVAIFLAHAVIIGATGGAAAIPLLAIGLGTALYQTGKGGYKLSHAKTEAEKKKAIYELGAGIANGGLLIFGTKTALKEGTHGGSKLSPEEIDRMSAREAMSESMRQMPESLRESYKAVGSGNMLENTRSFTKRQIQETRETMQDTHSKFRDAMANRKEKGWSTTLKELAGSLMSSFSFSSMLSID